MSGCSSQLISSLHSLLCPQPMPDVKKAWLCADDQSVSPDVTVTCCHSVLTSDTLKDHNDDNGRSFDTPTGGSTTTSVYGGRTLVKTDDDVSVCNCLYTLIPRLPCIGMHACVHASLYFHYKQK